MPTIRNAQTLPGTLVLGSLTADVIVGSTVLFGGSPWFDVTNPIFAGGAKGNGVTDDTAAIQAAIQAAPAGGVIYFPPGTYIQTAALTNTTSGLTFRGAGKTVSILRKANSVNQVQIQLTGALNNTFEYLGFYQNGENQTTNWHSIAMDWTSDNCTIQHCSFTHVEGFAIFVNFDAVSHRVNNLRVLFCDLVQNVGANHDSCSFVTQGGCLIGNRWNIQGTGSGFDVYESNDCPIIGNTILMNGTSGHGISIMSCDNCPAIGNTIFAGANDAGFWIRQETDNGFARTSINTLLNGNMFRGTASSIFMVLENTSLLSVTNNTVDTAYFVQYNIGPIDQVMASGNRLINLTALESVNVTPTNVRYMNNPGMTPDIYVDRFGHLISGATGTPVTSALGANVSSATFTGNDTRGTIAIVMSGALAANTRVCTATFANSYGATPPKVTLVDQTSAVGLTIVNSYVLSQSTGVSFDIAFDQALAAGTYTLDYIVIG